MKSTFLKVGAALGASAVAVLAAGPALAAANVSQAYAQGIDLALAGNHFITGVTHATNNGKTETKTTVNTLPQLAHVTPGSNVAGLGVVLQDAFAKATGYSTACAGLTGQGGGTVQVGTQPCSITGGSATSLNLVNLDLGNLVASPSSVVGQVLSAIPNLNTIAGVLQPALVVPLTQALNSTLGNVGLNGSLGVVAATCEATPTSADGWATIANSHLGATLGGQTIDLVDLPAGNRTTNPIPANTHVLVNLNKVTQVVLNAVDTQLNNMLSQSLSTLGGNSGPLGALAQALIPLGSATQTLAQALSPIIGGSGTLQQQLITPLTNALQPLLQPLQQNILDITLNKQPVPQASKTFDTTALDLQVLPAIQQFTGGSSLVGGFIGHVNCGPNETAASNPTPNPTNTPGGGGKVPTGIDSGLAGGSNTSTIIAAMSVLLAASGAAGTVAYRRYWMPRG